MPVKSEHAPYLVHVGQKVRIHARDFAGKWGVIIEKKHQCGPDAFPPGRPDDFSLAYRVRLIPPMDGIPPEVWFWRFEFEVA